MQRSPNKHLPMLHCKKKLHLQGAQSKMHTGSATVNASG